MKKFLLSLAAAVCMTSAFAAETEITLTEGHTLLISDLEAAGATDNDIVTFYITNNSGASRSGWGIGGFANSDNWSPTESWTGKDGDSWTYEYTVAAIKAVAGTEPGQYHGIGITINIYNDCKVSKVTLSTAVETTSKTIWEGECTFDESWSGSQQIGKLNVKAGDKLVISAEPVEAVSWEWGGQIFVKSLAEGWAAIAPTVAVAAAGDFTVNITDSEITVEPYNLDKYTTTMVKELTEYGLVLQGIDAKITKVVLVQAVAAGIREVASDAAATRIYNLRGQQMQQAKGLCIVNGKVVMMK